MHDSIPPPPGRRRISRARMVALAGLGLSPWSAGADQTLPDSENQSLRERGDHLEQRLEEVPEPGRRGATVRVGTRGGMKDIQRSQGRKQVLWRLVTAGALALSMMAGSAGFASAAEEDQKPESGTLLERIEQLEQTVAQQQAIIQKLLAQGMDEAEPVEEGMAEVESTPSESELEQQLVEELGTGQMQADDPPQPPSPRPLTVISNRSGKSYMNISLDGLVAAGASSDPDVPNLQLGSHDPSRRGFTVQNVELVFSGAVDPYFTAQANIIFVESPAGKTEVEVEEIYATTTSLPYNLQVKAGHFFTEFGRLNSQHPHSWDFVDQPLSNARMFGPDGLRSSGIELSWLMPVPFFSELFLTIQNAFGETLNSFGFEADEEVFGRILIDASVRDAEDLLYVPRYAASLDLTDNQTLLVGASAARGPNGTGDGGRTAIYGADVFWKWKSPRAMQGFPFVKFQAEGMKRRYRAEDPLETFEDWAAYSQILWGYRRGWVAGIRYGRMGGDDGGEVSPFFEHRRRISTNLTWFPTEYSKLRLQYNHDDRDEFEDSHSLWLQFEFTLGAHAAHKF